MSQERDRLPVDLLRGLYETIFRRRDIREFRPDPIPDEVLARVLIAAHHAGSVGFTQPWNFLIVKDLERRREVKQLFEEERAVNADTSTTSAARDFCRSSSRAFWRRRST